MVLRAGIEIRLRARDRRHDTLILQARSHQALLYSDGAIFPEKTPHRHLSIIKPNGRNATFSSARGSASPVSDEAGGTVPSSPISLQVFGRDGKRDRVADGFVETVVGATAEEGRLFVVRTLVEIVASSW